MAGSRTRVTYGHEEPPPVEGKRYLEVGDGLFAVVDEDLWHRAREYRWSLKDNGEPRTQYSLGDFRGHGTITLKAFVIGVRAPRGHAVKNVDGDLLNCCRDNVRLVTLVEARAIDRKNLGPLVRAPRRKERMRLSRFTKAELEQQRAERAAAKNGVTSLIG